MPEALEALVGFTAWIVVAAAVLAAVAAVVGVPAYLGSSFWHRKVRGDRRCAQCDGWFAVRPGDDAGLTRCSFCRGEVSELIAARS